MTIKRTSTRRKLGRKTVSELVVVRLILYRRILRDLAFSGTRYVFSHQLAVLADVTPEQLRRDLMNVRYEGSPTRGYEVVVLEERIGTFLDPPTTQSVALVGVGNLGRALFAYFLGRRPLLQIVAAFDIDPAKVDRMINGCPSYHISEARTVMRDKGINVAMIAVPAAAAQSVADTLVEAGVRSLLNFADVRLRLPPDVYVEHIDIGVTLEKVAFFARRPAAAGKDVGSP
jgi:redox-sensing transcriptional repressor